VYPVINNDRDDHLMEEEEDAYPSLENLRFIPAFRHSFELQYTRDAPDEDEKNFVDDHIAEKRGWDRQERELMALLEEVGASSPEPTSIDLGRLWLCRYQGRYIGMDDKPHDSYSLYGDFAQFESNKWFLLVPSIPWPNEVDLDTDDYIESEIHQDILAACSVLGEMDRVAIRTNLRLVVPPASARDALKNELPFCLQVELTVSLVVPYVLQAIDGRNLSKRDVAIKEDAQRRLLAFLFPPSDRDIPRVAHPSDTGSTDIPFLYSILTPAPCLSSTIAEEGMQPSSLLPTLLPFQRRSVGWMLEREGKCVTSDGIIVPKSSVADPKNSSSPLFWDKIELGEGDIWYIHRLTGTLSSELPEEECPPGGILAEEPGLGKTLECIALVLLNPAPGRNPTVSWWEGEAQIILKEIKVSFRFHIGGLRLTVTPRQHSLLHHLHLQPNGLTNWRFMRHL
jgi:E3 ubiquitin-protein ligase SHPRH